MRHERSQHAHQLFVFAGDVREVVCPGQRRHAHGQPSDFYIVYNQGFETAVPGPRDYRTRGRSLAVKATYWLSR